MVQIEGSNIAAAIELLRAGFPGRTRCFWERGLAKLAKSRAHAGSGEPLGYLLPAGDKFIGVGLTAVSYRPGDEQRTERKIVNLSSWFVHPEHRWKLPLLLRRMMHDGKAAYTDLTPTRNVAKILEKLDFEPQNAGLCMAFAPLTAARSSLPLLEWRQSHLCPGHEGAGQLIEDHLALGCEVFSIETQSGFVPLVLKRSRVMGLPGMTVIYCPDHSALSAGLGAVCRRMISCGRIALLFDMPVGGQRRLPPGTVPLPHKPRRYMRNCGPMRGIDHSYSELVYFDI